MATKITIIYDPAVVESEKPRKSANICNVFEPGNCYTDTEAFEGTKWDANVYGMASVVGEIAKVAQVNIPMSVPLAQINMAMMATANSDGKHTYSFEVDDYKEVVYYTQLGKQLSDQGISVTTEEVKEETTPEVSGGGN